MCKRQSGPSRPRGRKDPDMNRSLERKFAVRFGRALPTVSVSGVALRRSVLQLPPSVMLLRSASLLAHGNPNRLVAVGLCSPLRVAVRSQWE